MRRQRIQDELHFDNFKEISMETKDNNSSSPTTVDTNKKLLVGLFKDRESVAAAEAWI